MQFPKRLTIQIPALQHEGLDKISQREPGLAPSTLLENVLAEGIMARIATFEDDSPNLARSVRPTHEVDVPETVAIPLGNDQREALSAILHTGDPAELRKLVQWLFEWGLDAYSERLAVVENEGDLT